MKMSVVEGQTQQSLDYIKALLEEQKNESIIQYSELKLRLPTYLKSATIQQVREAGGLAEPDIILTKRTEDLLRRYVILIEKLSEVNGLYKDQVTEYYKSIKRTLPKNILNKHLGYLDDEDWTLLRVDRRQHKQE